MSSAENPGTPQHHGAHGESMVRALTWRDGFVFALNMPIGLFLTLGYTVGAIGGWTAIAIWGVACALALLQNNLFAEMAAMFPNRSGGISVYAYEGWKRHFAPLGAIAAFGYWMGWSLSLSVEGVVLGTLIEQAFFPDSRIALQLPIGHELGLPYLIAIGAIFTAWALNYFGVKIAAGVAKITGTLLVVGLLVLIIGPFLTHGDFDASRLSWSGASSPFGWKEIVVWFYITAWTTYGTEVCASFTAEYKDPVKDTSRALRRSAAFILGLYILVPYVVVGALGEATIGLNPVNYIGLAFDQILGDYSWLGQLPVMAAFVIAMMTATADGGRSLYGISRTGGTVRQLGVLNRYGVPGRALTTDMLINITVLIVLGEPIAILLASNLGYLTAVTLAVGAFVLLRRDQPHLPRPIRLGRHWIPIACILFAINVFAIVIGISNPSLTGYGGLTETVAGIGILLFACVLWYYRQRFQDRQRIEWRVTGEPPAPAKRGLTTATSDAVDPERI
ncbi:APC family permease [Rhodococcus koreensis]|uniref:Amino acid transporter n=1 Tax=Rhodococcus koreensis TaxID=99653 RepID=A0A1H4L631_9NOCA|nr:APC family permease [Rhodococcus koreensis]SEB66204.1 Amino acid transporter [Rhodococcus koreensis]